jgi:ribosomal protein S6
MAEKKEIKVAEVPVYEVGYHLVSSIPEEQVPAQVAALKEVIASNGGVIVSEEAPRLVDLSYEMVKVTESARRRYTTAYFGWVKFDADPSKIAPINKAIEALPSMLRFILIKTTRDNTLYGAKLADAKDKPAKAEDAPEASVEEIDKTIDKMVVEAAK